MTLVSYAVIDFETTGLSAGPDRIIEVAAAVVRDGIVVDTFNELMDPGFAIPTFITSLTGISTAMIRGKPRPQAVMPALRTFLGEHPCVAHNASFDRRFFEHEMALAGVAHQRTFLCSLMLARRLFQDLPDHKLATLVQRLGLQVPTGLRAHRALADVLMTCELWKHLLHTLGQRCGGRQPCLEVVQAVSRKPKSVVANYLSTIAARPVMVSAGG
jgi:DNA polymerase-3 subunit epsilon